MNMREIKAAAKAANIECIVDREGDVCLRPMEFDGEGRRVVTLAPDPCEFGSRDSAGTRLATMTKTNEPSAGAIKAARAIRKATFGQAKNVIGHAEIIDREAVAPLAAEVAELREALRAVVLAADECALEIRNETTAAAIRHARAALNRKGNVQ